MTASAVLELVGRGGSVKKPARLRHRCSTAGASLSVAVAAAQLLTGSPVGVLGRWLETGWAVKRKAEVVQGGGGMRG